MLKALSQECNQRSCYTPSWNDPDKQQYMRLHLPTPHKKTYNLIQLWRRKVATPKLTRVCLLYAKGISEDVLKVCCPYNIRIVLKFNTRLGKNSLWVKSSTEKNISKDIYSISCSCGALTKGKPAAPSK